VSTETLRWHCPHNDIEALSLHAALFHLKEQHTDCWSCFTEQMILAHLINCPEPDGKCHWFVESFPLAELERRIPSLPT